MSKPLSRTAAKRQAHRESRIYRWEMIHPKRWTWRLVANGSSSTLPTKAAAAVALASWRAARVRELMGRPLSHLPAIKQCTVCGKGTARQHPTKVLECDNCGALGDPYLGMMEPLARSEEG